MKYNILEPNLDYVEGCGVDKYLNAGQLELNDEEFEEGQLIIDKLSEGGFLFPNLTLDDIQIGGSRDHIYVNEVVSGYPIYELKSIAIDLIK
jgi:hypothetical protein